MPRYAERSVVEPAFTAADAVTQVRVRHTELEMRIVSVEPADADTTPSYKRH